MSFADENAIRQLRPWWMVEIEGVRRRFATFEPYWNPPDTGVNRHIKTWLADIPRLGGQDIQPLDGTATISSHSFGLHDVGGAITEMVAVSDTPAAKTFLTASIPKSDATHIAVHDFSEFDEPCDVFIERETFYCTTKTTRTDSGTGDEMTGSADAGSGVDYMIDAARTESDDYWVGAILTFTGGANAGQSRVVTRFIDEPPDDSDHDFYSGASGSTLYVDPANPFPNTISAGDTYELLYPPNKLKDVALDGGGTPDYWLGAKVLIITDTDYPENVGEQRWVKSWDETNSVLEFYDPLPAPTGTGTGFSIVLYAFTSFSRAKYGSEAAEHAVLDDRGDVVIIDVVDKLPFIKSRRCWVYENRVDLAEAEAKMRAGVIENFSLDPSGEVFRFECSGILKAIAGKLMSKQLKSKVALKAVWGGYFQSITTVGGSSFVWPVMVDGETTDYAVTEIYTSRSDGMPSNGANIMIDEEIIRYKETRPRWLDPSNTEILDKLVLGEQIEFDSYIGLYDKLFAARQYSVGPDTCALHARGMFADMIGIEQIKNEWVEGRGSAGVQEGGVFQDFENVGPAVSAFMQEHEIGADIVQVCVCDGTERSDFPQFDVIEVTGAAGAFSLPATITGSKLGSTATAVAYDSTRALVTIIRKDGDFQVDETITDGTFSADIAAIYPGDGTSMPARNNPITVLLQFLLSTGTGENGEFDTLPDGWGIGFDEDLVDVDAIKQLRDRYFAGVTIDFAMVEPTAFKEWAEDNIYRLLQIFPFETLEGKLSLGKLYVEDECREFDDGSLNEFGGDEIRANGLPDWSSGNPPVTKVIIKYNKHPAKSEYFGELEINFKRSKSYYQDFGSIVKFEASTLYLPNTLIRSMSPNDPEIPGLLAWLINPMFCRHTTHPAPVVKAVGNHAQATRCQIGDVVKVTHPSMPNLRTGDRGLSGEYFQILGVENNPNSDETTFTLWQVGVHDSKHGVKCPSAVVYSYAADTPSGGKSTLTLYERRFNRILSGGYDRDDFQVDDEIILLTDTYDPISGATPERATIEAIGTGSNYTIILDQNLTNPPSQGDLVELATYNYGSSTRKSTRVYLADENRELGSANDSAFKYK